MGQIKVVSIDIFGTLVDPDVKKPPFWLLILGDTYTNELANKYRADFLNSLYQYLKNAAALEKQFLSLKALFEICFSKLFGQIGLDYNVKEATQLLVYYHLHSPLYNDSMLFLNSVGKKYPICLASDMDDDMIGTLKQMYTFDHIFTSEQLRLYKATADGRFFSAISSYYGVRPEEVMHIGDGILEIVGASKAGIITCWLNRTGTKWSHAVKPNYEVSSLIEVAAILGVRINS